MKCVPHTGRLTALALMLMVFSCRKNDATVTPEPDGAAAGIFQRVEHMSHIKDSISGYTWDFVYNKYQDPEAIITNVVSDGNPNQYFLYDSQRRMVQYIRMFSFENSFETFREFVYDPIKRNRIIRDTGYLFGRIVHGRPVEYTQKMLRRYWYDSLDRVIQERWNLLEPQYPDSMTFTYQYDQRGNLIRNGVEYDDKVNIHRASRVFMFLDRDYSINNPFRSRAYTRKGMPKHIERGLHNERYFLQMDLDDANITYPSATPEAL